MISNPEIPLKPCYKCISYSPSGKCVSKQISSTPEPLFWAILKCGPNREFFQEAPDENPRPA